MHIRSVANYHVPVPNMAAMQQVLVTELLKHASAFSAALFSSHSQIAGRYLYQLARLDKPSHVCTQYSPIAGGGCRCPC